MDTVTLLKNSLIVHHWPLVIAVICVCLALMAAYRNGVTTAKSSGRSRRLDGEEDVGVAAALKHNNSKTTSDDTDDSDETYTPALEDRDHIRYEGATKTMPGGAEEFYGMMNNRRSVRSYSRRSVPLATVERCVHAAGTSPSGAHTEPWTFCIVSDAGVKAEIRRIVESEEELNYAHRMHRQWTTDLQPLRTSHHKPYLTDAPHLILVFKQTYGQTPDGNRRQHYYHEISTAIATGVLLCALQAAGLCSLVTTPLNCGPALRTLLDRPANEKLLVLLPVGYAAEDCCVPDLKRKRLDEIVVRY